MNDDGLSEKTYTPDEQKAFRKKWVEALRSGQYTQGRHELNGTAGFCCLGVACEVLKDDIGLLKIEQEEGRPVLYGKEENPATAPKELMDALGLRHNCGDYGSKDVTQALTSANDYGTSFDDIADIIESEPKGLFL